ncbi:adherens junction-associated protein 1 isoform X1 [Haplochromis burtoni]|uniref:adherens junction-associated protein 1 isoform X1 n=1 Tax=Haplochromis burtoni TaxID=8153 RepID=UPI001C2D81D9|nr:adherens junction-associated protein 1 isoform X1 [Haplochromis burtoni]
MWIKRSVARSPSALKPGSCVGHRVWILLAMTHLTLDFSVCSPLSQGLGIKLTPKPVPRSRPRLQPLWDKPNMLHWRTVSPLAHRLLSPVPPPQDSRAGIVPKVKGQKHWKPAHKGQAACKNCRLRYSQKETGDPLAVIAKAPVALSSGRLLIRTRRQLKWDSYDKSQEGRTTTVAGFIDWGPTGTDSIDEDGKMEPNLTSTRAATTTVATTTSTTTRLSQRTFTVVTTTESKSTTKSSMSNTESVKPPKLDPPGDTPGLAVHQIITITVSLIMVIAALITTLVLKNCACFCSCAQSGNGRHNSHQRKIHQQEESCQNLTDFTPARVPSKVDIFTAYNDSLQCSHECVRTAVPIYTDEMIQQTPVYKTAYNGNRPSPTERQLIPVAFVSEKWFEISC